MRPFRCALEGIADACATQHHMRIHVVVAILVVLVGVLLRLPRADLLLLVMAIALVIIAELVNSAVELVVDLASPAFHPVAGRAKNVAAGAVLFAALVSAAVGAVILIPPMLRVLSVRPVSARSALLAATACALLGTIVTAFLPRTSGQASSNQPASRRG